MAIAIPLSSQLAFEAKPPIRVLFFDHTAALGGGEIALANLISHLDTKKIKPVVVLAAEGPLADRLRSTTETYVLPLPAGVTGQKKDGLGFASLFRVREALSVFRYVCQLARFMRSHDVTLVHTNSLKADIIGGLAARLAGIPVVWHVRDRIEDDYLPKCVVRIFRRLARVIPNYVIANSGATLRSLRPRKGTRNISVISSGCELGGKFALGIESIVRFTGFPGDVQRALAELDLVVHASTRAEPFGQVIIEAMAAGEPVVATDGGGVPEIVDDGVPYRAGLGEPISSIAVARDCLDRRFAMLSQNFTQQK